MSVPKALSNVRASLQERSLRRVAAYRGTTEEEIDISPDCDFGSSLKSSIQTKILEPVQSRHTKCIQRLNEVGYQYPDVLWLIDYTENLAQILYEVENIKALRTDVSLYIRDAKG